MVRPYRNVSFATADSFKVVLDEGETVVVRGYESRELRNRVTTLAQPRERCLFLPGRHNDIFAQVAETIWVLAGQQNLPWLASYLPRAPDFSDDGGATWRGAYGPRLRSWRGGVDQIDEWRRLLLEDRSSRRAVGILFDPSRDFVESRDIPCNNWLSWLVRDDQLHMNIGVRSNDAMWGFSGVNAFEWSVLQEMLAFWVGASVGEATFFATSYHIYDRHYRRAEQIVNRFTGRSPYDFGISAPPFQTAWEAFPDVLEDWFRIEGGLRIDPDQPLAGLAMEDPFLASSLRLLRLKWGQPKWSSQRLKEELGILPEDDFAAAAYEYFGRADPKILIDIPQPRLAAYYHPGQEAHGSRGVLSQALKALHARKNASYGGAWKRRGERFSVLPNIARKVDRLEAFSRDRRELRGETILDTAVDLFVYAAKYRILLAEAPDADRSCIQIGAPEPFSDHDENFNSLVDMSHFDASEGCLDDEIRHILLLFEELWPKAEAAVSERQQLAADLTLSAERLIGRMVADWPDVASAFIHEELSLPRTGI